MSKRKIKKSNKNTQITSKKPSLLKKLFKFIGTVLLWLLIFFGIIALIFAIATKIKGYVQIKKFASPKIEELKIPDKTNKDHISIYNPFSKLKDLKVNFNGQEFTIPSHQKLDLQLKEGLNTLQIAKELNLKLIKIRSDSTTTNITKDTTAPKLLSSPKITNQGLVLEFTEPATIKFKYNNRTYTYKTDDSYTIIVPKTIINKTNSLNFTIVDSINNEQKVRIDIARTKKDIAGYSYNNSTLPESAGIEDIPTILGVLLLTSISLSPAVLLSLQKHK